MGRHQLFKKIPPKELVLELLNCFGFSDFSDRRCICKKYFNRLNVINNIKKLVPKLKKYYLPCKAKTYLTLLDNNSVLTILRQLLRPYKYVIVSREKYINGEKLINYSLNNMKSVEFKPIITSNDNKSIIVTFN